MTMKANLSPNSLSNPFKSSEFCLKSAKCLRVFGVPDGIRTRVTAVKVHGDEVTL
jgi:hypothetical protein